MQANATPRSPTVARARPLPNARPTAAVEATVVMRKEGQMDALIAIRTAIATLAVPATTSHHISAMPRNLMALLAPPRHSARPTPALEATAATAMEGALAAPAAAATGTAMCAVPTIT